ncbi:MerR family DNA-binding protein [Sphingomonas jatrophae]|uniref:MerR family transcriptional regulator, mercuric resistance operon regulatory protein n=1 Tax=Sphingomonas jatrophae TaxID=1166337 RepID=A0A1I6MA16_9SPHN|nr:MerR family DNA-binding protein [Sphingomonas jatrophae]SFS12549.1 MerR family transcriptional regulator, mercuric resistance operon regulatory protein [Sphingomonas jatrophae]
MAEMTIARLARAGAVGVETVRYYQRRGLMPQPARPAGDGTSGGVRRYDGEDVRRLRFIRSAQAAGFTLDEVGELLQLDAVDDRARARALARNRVAELDRRIAELSAARAALARLADACGKGEGGACPILSAFDGSNET